MTNQPLPASRESATGRLPGGDPLSGRLAEVRYGHRHRVVGLITVRVDELRVRKEPVMLAPDDKGEGPRLLRHPIDRYFPLVNGIEDRRVEHLPHLALLEVYDATGEMPLDSEYARLLRVRAQLEGRVIADETIAARMRGFLETYDSIRSSGYLGPGFRSSRIVVVADPIHPATETFRPEGPEIFDGHHRAAILRRLGVDRVEVVLAQPEKVSDFDWRFA